MLSAKAIPMSTSKHHYLTDDSAHCQSEHEGVLGIIGMTCNESFVAGGLIVRQLLFFNLYIHHSHDSLLQVLFVSTFLRIFFKN